MRYSQPFFVLNLNLWMSSIFFVLFPLPYIPWFYNYFTFRFIIKYFVFWDFSNMKLIIWYKKQNTGPSESLCYDLSRWHYLLINVIRAVLIYTYLETCQRRKKTPPCILWQSFNSICNRTLPDRILEYSVFIS